MSILTLSNVFQETQYQAVTLANFEKFSQIQRLPEELIKDIRVVGSVLPFKTNTYVINRLIDWSNVPDDPIFTLTFPRRGMLTPEHYLRMEKLIDSGADPRLLRQTADEIRLSLNPHPDGQMRHNLPVHRGQKIRGMQHKYHETILFFPSQGQTCHAYCTFCFRWAQFVGIEGLKFATQEAQLLKSYLLEHPEITDVLFTGGDPMVIKTEILAAYFNVLLDKELPRLRTIRIGTKALTYWPQRFVTDSDAKGLLALFEKTAASGKQLAVMAHFNHYVELSTPEARAAIRAIRKTGAQILTQSPVMKHINDKASVWARMWRRQYRLGCIPYYMFVARDTGAQRYFEVPLARAWEIFRKAYSKVSGVARTVRGPSMSATPGKVQVLGVTQAGQETVFALNFIQARNPDWVGRPFFAKFDPQAVWLDDLKPAFGDKEFFYQKELDELLAADRAHVPPVPIDNRF
ncbi:MAG: lysine 2,3-aminomutase [Elusimicrobia bacterium RIFCSPLOWO2_12_FULL_59_9]|nr:MAG: lysine 2,3-aminomutase [Elusimicrobia bacterium RIFCSPLOWO2_12_FULL_59_9]